MSDWRPIDDLFARVGWDDRMVATIVSNQTNGIASFARAVLVRYSAERPFRHDYFATPSDSGVQLFSDRWVRDLSGDPDFVQGQPFDRSKDDMLGVQVRPVGDGSYRVTLILASWGNVKFDLSATCEGGLIMGWGNPVGNLVPRAWYVVALQHRPRR